MRKAINWGIQINKRTVRMIKLERLLRCEVGTGKVESLAERLAMESKGGRILERVEMVKILLKWPGMNLKIRDRNNCSLEKIARFELATLI